MEHDQPFRWILAALLVAAVSISGHHRRKARRLGGVIERRQEAPRLIAGRLAFGLPVLLSLLAFVARPRLLAWSSIGLPMPVRWLGVALGIAAIPLVFWTMKSIGSNVSETVLTKPHHELVTVGPYRRIRHPLYATGLLLLSAASLMTANWLIMAFTVAAAIAIWKVVIPVEEGALVAKFGDRYREYMTHTGRLTPTLRTGPAPGQTGP